MCRTSSCYSAQRGSTAGRIGRGSVQQCVLLLLSHPPATLPPGGGGRLTARKRQQYQGWLTLLPPHLLAEERLVSVVGCPLSRPSSFPAHNRLKLSVTVSEENFNIPLHLGLLTFFCKPGRGSPDLQKHTLLWTWPLSLDLSIQTGQSPCKMCANTVPSAIKVCPTMKNGAVQEEGSRQSKSWCLVVKQDFNFVLFISLECCSGWGIPCLCGKTRWILG